MLRRAPIKRSSMPMCRTRLQARPRRSAFDTAAWRDGLGPCIVCGAVDRIHERVSPNRVEHVRIDGHHVIPKSVLIRHGLSGYVADKRNRVALCRTHHANHHSRSQPLTREQLPASVFEFAAEVGLTWWLEKHYVSEAVAA